MLLLSNQNLYLLLIFYQLWLWGKSGNERYEHKSVITFKILVQLVDTYYFCGLPVLTHLGESNMSLHYSILISMFWYDISVQGETIFGSCISSYPCGVQCIDSVILLLTMSIPYLKVFYLKVILTQCVNNKMQTHSGESIHRLTFLSFRQDLNFNVHFFSIMLFPKTVRLRVTFIMD